MASKLTALHLFISAARARKDPHEIVRSHRQSSRSHSSVAHPSSLSRARAVARSRIARSALARTDLLLDGRPAGHRSTLGKSSHRLTRARGAARHRSSNSRRQHRARGRQRLTRSIDGVGEGSIGGASNRRVVTRKEYLSRDNANAPTIRARRPTRASRKRRASRPSRPSSFVLFVLDVLLVVERSGL